MSNKKITAYKLTRADGTDCKTGTLDYAGQRVAADRCGLAGEDRGPARTGLGAQASEVDGGGDEGRRERVDGVVVDDGFFEQAVSLGLKDTAAFKQVLKGELKSEDYYRKYY